MGKEQASRGDKAASANALAGGRRHDAVDFDVDVAIVGGGVGGVAAALWCARLALRFVLLEQRERLGGQLFYIHNPIPDYLGLHCDGKGFADQLTAQLKALDIVPQLGAAVQEVSLDEGLLQTTAGRVRARAIIAATGATRRRLDVPGIADLDGQGGGEKSGVYYSFSGHREAFRGRRVCVVGGGDGAFENALMLADCCPQVTIVQRREASRARQDFVDAVAAHPAIAIMRRAQIVRVCGDDGLQGVVIQQDDQERQLDVDILLVKIGLVTVRDWLGDGCQLSSAGTLVVDANQQTSHPRLWAVGDICTPQDPSISVSVGQACLAVRHIQRCLAEGAP